MNNKQTTSIIALSALIVTFAMPNAFAGAGTVEAYYWQNNPEMCYLSSELNDLDFEDTTSQSSAIESELDDSVSTYNAEMNGITINGDDGSCPTYNIEVGAYDLGEWTWLAETHNTTYYYPSYAMIGTDIDFNTYHGFGDESNGCSSGDYDIEWVMNHELGHAVGLKHHHHVFGPVDSVMYPWCNSVWSTLQSVDDTAIDIHYS